MPIELTNEQTRQISREKGTPVGVRDPESNARYVLVPAEQYEQMLEIVEDDAEQRALRRAGARSLAKRLDDPGE
jgi:hypothetical protein